MTTWRDNLRPASFRGAEFHVQDGDTGVGRRTAKHEYPLRELPYVEDLGRRARSYQVTGYVIGAEYMAARDALLAACEEPGPGSLVHPYLGTLEVTCQACSCREGTDHGGEAVFSLTFEEAGKREYPAQATDFTAQAATAAGGAREVAGDVFRQVYSAAGPAWLAAAARGDVKAALKLVRAVAQAMPSPHDAAAVAEFLDTVEEALATAEELAAGDADAVAELVTEALEGLGGVVTVEGALEVVKFGAPNASPYGGTVATVPETTTTRQGQAQAQGALVDLVRRLAASAGVEAALGASYDSYEDAAATRANLLEALDGLMLDAGETGDDDAYQALRGLYVTTAQGMAALGADLAHVRELPAPAATMPALALAYDLYGDLGRAEEIADRNGAMHPGLLPGGESLRVLDA